MLTNLSVTETDYFLPEDGSQARSDFLSLMQGGSEVWIAAFGFNLADLFTEIKAADAAGVKVHMLLDHSQSLGHYEAPVLLALWNSLSFRDIVLTTAGINSPSTRAIWHTKGMVAAHSTSIAPDCWEGSTNFSETGWVQGNTARKFTNQTWAAQFVSQFNNHRQWALINEAVFQFPQSTFPAAGTLPNFVPPSGG